MRISVLDASFELLGEFSIYRSLIWNRRYYEPGVFEIHTAVEYFPLLNSGRYIFRHDRQELGVIREVNYTQTSKGARTAYCKGYFSEALFNNRVTVPAANITGTPEEISRSLVTTYFISPSDGGRVFPQIRLGALSGLGASTTLQSTGDQIGDKMYELERTQELSHRLVFDFEENVLTFEVWAGLDRTDDQEVNSPATFSNAFYNVKNVVYDRDASTAANFAYVAGEGEDADRVIVEVDARTDATQERREIFVDARDLQKTYKDSSGTERTYSDTQYAALLRQRGLEKLDEYAQVEVVNSDIDASANLVYMEDFDLGDLCTYQNQDVGIETVKRITEIQEVYEGSKATLNITFGNDESTSLTKIIRRETT